MLTSRACGFIGHECQAKHGPEREGVNPEDPRDQHKIEVDRPGEVVRRSTANQALWALPGHPVE